VSSHNEKYKKIENCIACDSNQLFSVLDLGMQPLANSYKNSKEEPEDFFPLAINTCEKCFHTQLTHSVNPDLLFKNYLYVSGTSQTQREYFEWFADFTIEWFGNCSGRRVLDVGCNDGTQLDAYKNRNWNTFGIDPAENLYEFSSKNHEVICDFFNKKYSNIDLYDIILCQNAFAHNTDQFDFMNTAKSNMHDNSLLFITTSQVDMITHNEFDTIYHEHLSFYTINSMNELCKRAGLYLIDVVKNSIHGNSYIYVISKNDKKLRKNHMKNLLSFEKSLGLHDIKTYLTYSKNCIDNANNLNEFIKSLKNSTMDNKQIPFVVGFGASAKGNTLMNFMKNGPDVIIDENSLKQGKYTPGVGIEIVSLDYLKKFSDENTIVFIPLAWNFFDEISKKIKNVRPNKKDVFVKYFPTLKVEGWEEYEKIKSIFWHPV
jgi:SAM-dependent methyltransferase